MLAIILGSFSFRVNAVFFMASLFYPFISQDLANVFKDIVFLNMTTAYVVS